MTGWGQSIRKPASTAKQNAIVLKRMSRLERELGITPEEYEQFHAENRARVRARWGEQEEGES